MLTPSVTEVVRCGGRHFDAPAAPLPNATGLSVQGR